MSLLLLVSAAWAADPSAPPDAASSDAPPPATSNAPVLSSVLGTWFVVSTVDGKPVVDWACTGRPTSVDLDTSFVMIASGESVGGTIAGQATRGDTLVLQTEIPACRAPKEMTLRWTDAEHHVLEITRCEGAPKVITTVHARDAGVAVVRQCCTPAGKMVGRVDIDSACPPGSQGQKPEALR